MKELSDRTEQLPIASPGGIRISKTLINSDDKVLKIYRFREAKDTGGQCMDRPEGLRTPKMLRSTADIALRIDGLIVNETHLLVQSQVMNSSHAHQ